MSRNLLERRSFLKLLGVSSAGISAASMIAASKDKITSGTDNAKEEIERLQKAYEELDGRSKLILRLILMISGLDVILAL